MFAGETNRGWGSRGTKPFAVQRLNWTGKKPFEVLEMKAVRGGFELVFTEPVDRDTAGDIKSYEMRAFTYIFQGAYGSPEVDESNQPFALQKFQTMGFASLWKSMVYNEDVFIIFSLREYARPGTCTVAFRCLLHTQLSSGLIGCRVDRIAALEWVVFENFLEFHPLTFAALYQLHPGKAVQVLVLGRLLEFLEMFYQPGGSILASRCYHCGHNQIQDC